jgi:hypothetical protein
MKSTVQGSKKISIISTGIYLFLFLSVLPVRAAIVDTVIYGNGGPGPYCIGSSFADTSTLTIRLQDSAAVPPWTLVPDRNALLFSLPIDSGVPIRITFRTTFYGVPKIFSLYTRTYLDLSDTARRSDTFAAPLSPPQGDEKVSVSGYKSIGVSIGSFGQVNLEQGLDVQIGGEIGPQTSVSAHLSDQGSSLDGQTREISDFDMINITLDNPSYRSVVGDQYAAWPFAGLVSGRKKIKGLSANYSPVKSPFSIGGFGALAGGQAAIETKQGRTGVQGPYYLTGNRERDFIQPVGGTVRVRLNGRELDEGADKDFTVDYELGAITFTPKNSIKDEDLVRVEYEYKMFNYQRTLLGTTAGIAPSDSSFSVQGVFWSESDNKSNPIDLTLTNTEVAALQQSGDHPPYASTAKPVHPNDVASESQFYPLYRKRAAGSDTFFVYAPFDRDHPDSVLGYYYVWFRKVNPGQGNYRVDFTDSRGAAYAYAGQDSGNYTDLQPLPAPQARRSGELRAALKTKGFRATLNIAGQDLDRNLYSSIDDRDNRAAATRFSFFAGAKERDRQSAWLSGSHAFTSQRFDAEVLSAYDRKEQWDDTRSAQTPIYRHLWDAAAGATIVPGLLASCSYGQNRSDSLLVTDRVSPALQYGWRDRFSLDYSGAFFRHLDSAEKGTGRREYGNARFTLPQHTVCLSYRDEWRSDQVKNGGGLYMTGLSYDFAPLLIHEQMSYLSKRKRSVGGSGSTDTGYSVRWEQSLDHSFLPTWRLSGSSSFDRSENFGADKSTTLLIDLTSDVAAKEGSGFSSRQHVRTNTEMASSFIQIPVFAGRGMGTHVYDSVRKEYVPHVPGDYFMQQQEVYDQSSSLRVRKTSADVTWSYEPRQQLKGILNDLTWQGALFCEEHVDARQNSFRTWVPGYSSLASYFGSSGAGGVVRYADLSYRQDIDWLRRSDSSSRTAKVSLSVTPAYRRIRSYDEGSIETRLETERPVGRWTLGCALNLLSLKHDDTTGADHYAVYDRRLELSQNYRIFNGATLSLLEVAGLAHKSTTITSGGAVPFDSLFYFQIAPSFSWQPTQKGNVSALYTYSVVPLPGEIDFRMARGFLGGVSHQLTITADVKMGERLLVIGTYRGDLRKPVNLTAFEPANHVFSLEVRVFM